MLAENQKHSGKDVEGAGVYSSLWNPKACHVIVRQQKTSGIKNTEVLLGQRERGEHGAIQHEKHEACKLEELRKQKYILFLLQEQQWQVVSGC